MTMKLHNRISNLETVLGARPHPATAANFVAMVEARKAAGDMTAQRLIDALSTATERPNP